MSKRIEEEQVTQAIRQAVEEKGRDFIYEDYLGRSGGLATCTYSDQAGAPSCIVGHVIRTLSPKEFTTLHVREWATDADEPSSWSADDALDMAHLDVPERAELALVAAQKAQDSGYPWGSALDLYGAIVNSDIEKPHAWRYDSAEHLAERFGVDLQR